MDKRKARTDGYDVTECKPGDLSKEDLAACIDLVVRGNAVDPASAKRTLPNAQRLAVIRKDGKIVGVGTVKPVRKDYATHTAEDSKYQFDPNTPELGYVAVDPDHRGNCLLSDIAESLAEYQGGLFARTSDPKMQSALKRAGFEQRGKEWKGQRADQLSLWMRTKPSK